MKIAIVGNFSKIHVGAFFQRAAVELGIESKIFDMRLAYSGHSRIRSFISRKLNRGPLGIEKFSKYVEREVRKFEPSMLLTTGFAPISPSVLRSLGRVAKIVNFSTDDPWNDAHSARWFLKSLVEYDHVFSTRTSNLEDFSNLGCKSVSFLPFAFDPAVYYPEKSNGNSDWVADVAFIGAADRDRIPYMEKILESGFSLNLYGSLWERFPSLAKIAKGVSGPETTRKVISNTKCALVLVRRANRDGHAMRTYEVAGMGAPMLVEDTDEHRRLFGNDGECVKYFRKKEEMVRGIQWFVDNPVKGRILGEKAQNIVEKEGYYIHRLQEIISVCSGLGMSV